jgi:hypothetical protein
MVIAGRTLMTTKFELRIKGVTKRIPTCVNGKKETEARTPGAGELPRASGVVVLMFTRAKFGDQNLVMSHSPSANGVTTNGKFVADPHTSIIEKSKCIF